MPFSLRSRFCLSGDFSADVASRAASLRRELEDRPWMLRPEVAWDALRVRVTVEFGSELPGPELREMLVLVQTREVRDCLSRTRTSRAQVTIEVEDSWIEEAACEARTAETGLPRGASSREVTRVGHKRAC